ncbi:MAG: accessory factor UbiK family protein, partial [Acidiferrobacterales bacterium]|nr:accessory factor UbiK family protein [Acidiferrobacterales bacterium]
EEFEVQKAVLAKTRAKLDQLETKVAVLESEFTEK